VDPDGDGIDKRGKDSPLPAALDELEAARAELLRQRQALLENAWVDARRTQLADAGRLTVQLGERQPAE
jgi:hypothetical protein